MPLCLVGDLLATDYSHHLQWPAGCLSWAARQPYLLAHHLHGVYRRQNPSSGPPVAINGKKPPVGGPPAKRRRRSEGAINQ